MVKISDSTTVTLGLVVAVGSILLGVATAAATVYVKMDDYEKRISSTEQKGDDFSKFVQSFDTHMAVVETRLDSIEKKVDRLQQ